MVFRDHSRCHASRVEGAWFTGVLQPRLTAVGSVLEKAGTPEWDPDELRSLTTDISTQINSAVAAGTITADEGIEAGHLLAELVRAHGGVATERRTVTVPTTVRIRGAFGRSREVAVETLGPKSRQRLYDGLVAALNRSVAEGTMTPEIAADTEAQARQQYGIT